MLYTITEHSVLTHGPEKPGSSDLVVPESAFAALKAYALRVDAEPILRYFVQNGRECLRVGPYAGVLQASSTATIEILPKIAPADLSPESIVTARGALLRMLLSVSELFPKLLPEGRMNQWTTFPMPEVLGELFLQHADPLLHRGVQTSYRCVDEERPFLKGRLRLQQRAFALELHPERLPVSFDERTRNNPPNRLLKACLQRLRFGTLARRVRQYLFVLDGVEDSINWQEDLAQARRQDRTFRAYTWLWPWAQWLLGGRAPGLAAGNNQMPGLLFPTQRLFERYVAVSLKKYLPPEFEVSIQEAAHHLLFDFAGEASHQLRPDIVVRRGTEAWILDTKWKRIQGDAWGTSSLTQSDLYQLYAYGQRYLAGSTQVILGLIYPRTADFTAASLPHTYEPHLPLYVLPADLAVPAREMVHQLWEALK